MTLTNYVVTFNKISSVNAQLEPIVIRLERLDIIIITTSWKWKLAITKTKVSFLFSYAIFLSNQHLDSILKVKVLTCSMEHGWYLFISINVKWPLNIKQNLNIKH